MLDFNIQLARTNELLERIAIALERAVGPELDYTTNLKKRDASSLVRYGINEKTWKKEQLGNIIHPMGLAPAQEQALLDQALQELEDLEGQAP